MSKTGNSNPGGLTVGIEGSVGMVGMPGLVGTLGMVGTVGTGTCIGI